MCQQAFKKTLQSAYYAPVKYIFYIKRTARFACCPFYIKELPYLFCCYRYLFLSRVASQHLKTLFRISGLAFSINCNQPKGHAKTFLPFKIIKQ